MSDIDSASSINKDDFVSEYDKNREIWKIHQVQKKN